MKLRVAPYPLLSIVSAIALLAYFYLWAQPDLRTFYHVPEAAFFSPVPEVLLALFALLVWLELRHVQHRRATQKQAIRQLRQQVDELLDNRKQLNAKAHVYANHADKLKLFISDKLLEYIEYDEKFLHFKSIASEVRHNGVISYDKVATALERQLEATGENDAEIAHELLQARDSLRYLWDLLDLSTADNIALHIANQVCDNEERLFQSELSDTAGPLPDDPTFDPQRALEKALARCFGIDPVVSWEDDDAHYLSIPEQHQVWIRCRRTAPLLGNENHIVLALENVISNAQYFAGRRASRGRDKNARIAMMLTLQGNRVCYTIYNRGPHIQEEDAGKLFQLGYSTRRARQHHGKGMGLYFVNEIVKGYEGQLTFTNVSNRADVLSLRLEMANGEVITDVIELIAETPPRCRKSGGDSAVETLHWELFGRLDSVEVTHQSDQQTYRFPREALEEGALYDPSSPETPQWALTVEPQGESSVLFFKPLDVGGVRFEIRLPSLDARMEGDLLTTDQEDMERQVADIAGQFRALEE